MHRALAALCSGYAVMTIAADPWPAEPRAAAVNLTSLEGPAPNDFYQDLSGAYYNPISKRLWVVRNGPTGTTSKLWALRENGSGGWEVDTKNGQRAEWTGFGDLEDLTFADPADSVVFLIIEAEERIKSYDVSQYGVKTPLGDWNTRPFLPQSGGLGAEGIAFVPDQALRSHGFVDRTGQPYLSRNGLGGLFFVGHQNGGALFAFDLDPNGHDFDFVGEYRTSLNETAAVSFDPSTSALYVWHDAEHDVLEKCGLSSSAVSGQSYRRLDTVRSFDGPNHSEYEGIAILPIGRCGAAGRSVLLTIDDGGAESLLEFKHFRDGCAALRTRKPVPPEGAALLQLDWQSGASPYTLRRSLAPTFEDSTIELDRQPMTHHQDDVLDNQSSYFYRLE